VGEIKIKTIGLMKVKHDHWSLIRAGSDLPTVQITWDEMWTGRGEGAE